MKTLFTNFLLLLSIVSISSCTSEDNPVLVTTSDSVVTIQSSSYTNDGTVAYQQSRFQKILQELIVPSAFAASVTDFKFCITKMKVVLSGSSTPGASSEAVLGLVDVSNAGINNEWGTVELADGSLISEIHFEVHKDAQKCGGADYSVSYNGVKLNQDLEFKFKFAQPLAVNHGDTVNLGLGVIAKAMEDAKVDGNFNDAGITAYFQANTIGTGEEL